MRSQTVMSQQWFREARARFLSCTICGQSRLESHVQDTEQTLQQALRAQEREFEERLAQKMSAMTALISTAWRLRR